MSAVQQFHDTVARNADRLTRLRDLAAAGATEFAPKDDRPTMLVRSRILEAIAEENGDLQGKVVHITAQGLACAPLRLSVFKGRSMMALHVGTRWEANCACYSASLSYMLDAGPF